MKVIIFATLLTLIYVSVTLGISTWNKINIKLKSILMGMDATSKAIKLCIIRLVVISVCFVILLILSTLLGIYISKGLNKTVEPTSEVKYEFKGLSRLDKVTILMDAIGEIESKNDSTAKSSISTASGHLQILKGTVDECNNILKAKGESKRFTYDDRHSKEKSKDMFMLLNEKYNPKGDIERAIRMWNGGPNYSIGSTQEYYERVIKEYNKKMEHVLNSLGVELIKSSYRLD